MLFIKSILRLDRANHPSLGAGFFHFCLAAKRASPVPNKSIDAGSGTGAGLFGPAGSVGPVGVNGLLGPSITSITGG